MIELYRRGEFSVREMTFGRTNGFAVFRDGATAVTRVASIGYPGDKGLAKAIAEVDRRDKETESRNPMTAIVDELLTAVAVDRLPVGSIVWLWVDGRVNGSPLIVIPGGKLTQIALLPERAGGQEPGGDPVADWGREFVLVSTGNGRLSTHGTAQLKAEKWLTRGKT